MFKTATKYGLADKRYIAFYLDRFTCYAGRFQDIDVCVRLQCFSFEGAIPSVCDIVHRNVLHIID